MEKSVYMKRRKIDFDKEHSLWPPNLFYGLVCDPLQGVCLRFGKIQ